MERVVKGTGTQIYQIQMSAPHVIQTPYASQASSARYCFVSGEETEKKLQTDGKNGLTEQEAHSRFRQFGPNAMHEEEEEPLYRKFLDQFTGEPLILMLIGSAVVSLFLGNTEDAVSITLAIIFVVGVGFVQEYRSEQSLKALNTLVPPQAELIRTSGTRHVLAEQLVPGDLVTFSVGDRIPADVRLLKAVHLMIDESALTGETDPVEKHSETLDKNAGSGISTRFNIAFMGTLVTAGKGIGIVVGTGHDTEFGQIFVMMNSLEKPKTPLQNAMDRLGHQLSMVSFAVIGFICLVGIIQGRSWLEMFQVGVSLAVAAIPEGLPIIVTVTLALGVLRMAKSNAIVRRLPSVETLGSVNVICTDKTGTLTMNKLHVAALWTAGAKEWCDIRMKKKEQVTSNASEDTKSNVNAVLETALYCNDARLQKDQYTGNSVDVALMQLAVQFGHLTDDRKQHERLHDSPFNSRRKWMAVGINGHTYVKGAYERVLPLCSNGDELLESVEYHSNEMAKHGMRILALAYSDGISDNEDDIKDLTFAGLVAMYDPPRITAADSVRRLRESGVKVVMITGDNEVTAVAAAREVGIPVPSDYHQYLMLGSTLEKYNDNDLSEVIENVLVFARTSPEMKVSIVRSLQRRGNIVAMTGDGVNDAPALKLADIGVAMGSGTDVAKEAGDMILVNDDFSTILQAIREGKAIFTNIKSFLTFQLSTSVAALSLIVCSTLFKLPNPLNAMQVLWINILMDGPPAQSLGVEQADPEEMRKPPRARNDDVLSKRIIESVLWRGMLILAGTLYVYVREIHNSGEVFSSRNTTMSFTTFVLFDLFNALSSRSHRRSIFQVGLFSNTMFNAAIGLSLLGQLAVVYLRPFQSIFQTEALSLGDLLYIIAIASSILWVDEGIKYWRMRKHSFVKSLPIKALV